MISTSTGIGKLTTALIAARKSYKTLVKKTTNPFYNKKYADLAEVLDCTLEALNDNGLAIIQFPYFENERAGVATILAHTSGEFIQERTDCPGEQKSPQTFGISITYLRRYIWQSIAGIAAEDDDDGNGMAQTPPNRPKVNQTPAKPKNEPRPSEPVQKTDKVAAAEPQPPEQSLADSLPTKGGLKDIQGVVREWATKVDKDDLVAFIRRETGQEDSKMITTNQWAKIFTRLEEADKNNKLKELVKGEQEQ